jgi:N-acetylglutamate synthase-like GNAT family acetyltransferase
MSAEKIEVRPATPDDFLGMVEALRHYHFKLLPTERSEVIDSSEGDTMTIYNEVSRFDFENAFVACCDDRVVGCAHWRAIGPETAKTTLISVDPKFRGRGVGRQLQEARMRAAAEAGAKTLVTFCDTDKSTQWYIKHFGYRIVGEERDHHRLHYFEVEGRVVWGIHFGFPGHVNGTKLVCDLEKYFSDNKLKS